MKTPSTNMGEGCHLTVSGLSTRPVERLGDSGGARTGPLARDFTGALPGERKRYREMEMPAYIHPAKMPLERLEDALYARVYRYLDTDDFDRAGKVVELMKQLGIV